MDKTRSGFITIVGRPNVGKSTLLNALLGEKVAIVSSKPQTTRTRITGVLTKEETQLIFTDTPGLHKPKTKLSEHMVKSVKESVVDVDVAILVVEPTGEATEAELSLIATLKQKRLPAILVINKIDILDNKEPVAKKIQKFSKLYSFDEVMPLSAKDGDNVETLLAILMRYAKEGPHYFPGDALTDQPERVIVAELIREKILNLLRDEVPHGIAVAIEKMKERENGEIVDIEASIYCERDSHKGILIGKSGSMLKKIGSTARVDIESFLDIKVNLQCWVKVREDWRNKESIIKTLGLS